MRRNLCFGLFLAAGLVSCGGDQLVLPSEGEPAAISIVAGDNQSGRVGETLAQPVVVQVTDVSGRPVSGAMVEIELDGQMDTLPTGSDGRASAELALGSSVGKSTGHVRVVSPEGPRLVETTFTVTAVSASANGLALESGDGQSAPAGTLLPDPLVVSVTDAFGNPVAGAAVSWSALGGGTVSASSTITGADGITSVTRTLGPTAGAQATVATSAGLAGSPVTFTHTATSGSAAGVTIVSGDGQTGLPGATLPQPIVVRVADADGNPVTGAAVTWVVTAGGGSVAPSTGTTGSDGQTSTTWTLGTATGTNKVEAVVSGVGRAEFTATASAGSPAAIRVVSGNGQTGQVGMQLGAPLVVEVVDAGGHAVSGVTVTWTVSSGGGSVSPPTSATGSDGRASTEWTLGPTTGSSQKVRASATGVGSVEFTATGTPGSPSVLAIRTEPSDAATLDQSFSRQPVIQLRDAAGNDVKQAGVSVTAAIASGPGQLAGTRSRSTDADGRATFTDLAITGTAGVHTLIFAAPGFTSVESSSITVSPPANQAPTATNDSYDVDQGGTLPVAAPGVLGNDSDPEGGPLTAVMQDSTANGVLTLHPDGSFEYTPNLGFSGSDNFTYEASDGTNTSAPATVTITVNAVLGVNHPPSFLPGPDQNVRVQGGPQTVEHWATNISPGPADEASQLVTFIVRVDHGGKKLFAQEPAVSPDGTLTYSPKRQGKTTATVAAHDNGGTANGGQDTSPEYTVVFTFE